MSCICIFLSVPESRMTSLLWRLFGGSDSGVADGWLGIVYHVVQRSRFRNVNNEESSCESML